VFPGKAMQLCPHLSFNGECEAAFQFYARCLGGTITMMLKYGESPVAATHPAMADKVLHATLQLDDQRLTGADVASDRYERPQGFALQLNISDPSEAERIFHALAEGGRVQYALQETFWAERYGMVTDAFGIPWEINCGKAA
jgi:PhnB protein